MADISQDVVSFTANGNMSNVESGDTLELNFQRIQGRFSAMKALAYQDKVAQDNFDSGVLYEANFVNNNGLRTFKDEPSTFEVALKNDILVDRLQFKTPVRVEVCYDTVNYEEFTGSTDSIMNMLIEGVNAGYTIQSDIYGIKLYFDTSDTKTLSHFFLNIDTHGEYSYGLRLQKSTSGQTDVTTCTWSNVFYKADVSYDGYAVVTHEPLEWSSSGSKFLCVTISDIYPTVDTPTTQPTIYEVAWFGASPKENSKPYHRDKNQNVIFDKPVILPSGSTLGSFVEYVSQSLTDAQKEVARSNIGASAENHTHDGYATSIHSHEAEDIVQDSTHRFVTDTQKEQWNAKAEANHTHTGYAGSTHTHVASDITVDSTHRFVTDTEKATWNNKVDLVDGKVPASQLPSFVDDVLEYANLSSFPTTGETGKIYVALDTNKTYRWGGTDYVIISDTIALGETAQTAFRGDHGKLAYDHSQNSDVHVTAVQKTYWDGKAEGEHTHSISDITSLQSALEGKASTEHSHSYSDITGLATQLNAKAPLEHSHTGYATSGHTHSYNDLTDKPNIPEGVVVDSALSSTSENAIQNKVVKNALDGKAEVTHTHNASDITGLVAGDSGYDKTVKTQAEFDTMLASSNWGGIKSLLLNGEFTHEGRITIPSNVKTIVGVGGAKITLTGTSGIGFGYNVMPTTDDYSITGLHLVINVPSTNTSGSIEGFVKCRNLINCLAESTNEMSFGSARGFFVCTNLVNCMAKTYSPDYKSTGYEQCTNLSGCKVEALCGNESSTMYGVGFYDCKYASSCSGTSTADMWSICAYIDPYSCIGAPGGVLYINKQADFKNYLLDGNLNNDIREIVLDGQFTATQSISLPYYIQKIRGVGFTKITFNVTESIKCFKYASTSSGPYSFENLYIDVNATNNTSSQMEVSVLYRIKSVKDVFIQIMLNRTYDGTVGRTRAYAFDSCFDLVNCEATTYIENNVVANSIGTVDAVAYNSCYGVVGCYGRGSIKYVASSGSSTASVHAFGTCHSVVNSRGYTTVYDGTSESVTVNDYIFYNCDGMACCYPSNTGVTNIYYECYNVAGCIGYTS